jgi:hypothetical protein
MNTLLVWLLRPKDRRMYQHWYRNLYLYSNHWLKKASKIRKLAGYKCEGCGKAKRLDVHHKTYKRLFWEWNMDLLALCRECHGKEHK